MDAADLAPLEREVLAAATPIPKERGDLMGDCADLEDAATAALRAHGVAGQARIQGSVAKGTWLRDGADLDLFLLLDPGVPAHELETIARRVADQVLEDTRRKYAQHPYVMGRFRGRAVDMVPAYAVAAASAKMSAVDRTPFHTAWVRSNLDGRLRGHVRLAKLWLKGTGTYGAQTAIGGFSGYLVEVLVVRFGGFPALVAWLAGGARPRRIALGRDEVRDDVSPLVVVDPVDPARNCAAAVTEATLARASEAAQAYRATPDRRFFHPEPPRTEPAQALRSALQRNGEAWAGLELGPRTDRLDIVFPQFQRAARTLAAELGRHGLPVRRLDVAASSDESRLLVQFVCTGAPLPATRLHVGPRDDGKPHALRFREKWSSHPDAAAPVSVVDGQLRVEVATRGRTPAEWLEANLAGAALGKHVAEALPASRIHADPGAVPEAWAARVADVVLDRRPWTR